jgi:hypothetical protein
MWYIYIYHICMQLALASLPEEEYWKAVWLNTPNPTSLRELLKPGPQG